MRKKTTEEFIMEAKLKHPGDVYDYSKVNYTGKDKPVTIICIKHGDFEQIAKVHLHGSGCDACGIERRCLLQKTGLTVFIERAKQIHGEDTYDYSMVEYVNGKTKVIIICKIHKEFLQTPENHYKGGCKKCGDILRGVNRKFTKEQIIKMSREVHGDTYDYSNIEYNNGIIENIICKEVGHMPFSQLRHNHINCRGGCKPCADALRGKNRMYTTDQIIKMAIELHGDTYDYSKVEYTGIYDKIIIICKIHDEFKQTVSNHIRGAGCPFCVNKTEAKLYEQMFPLYPTLIIQFKQDWCKNIQYLPFDFCIPESKIIIELDGRQHFQQVSNWKTPEEQLIRDKYKERCANDNGYSVIRLLQEDVFYDTYDWIKELRDTIEQLTLWNDIANVYLCKNDEYELY